MHTMINVFITDDEYYVRTSLKNNFPWEENGFHIVGEANNGNTAYDMICSLKPDIAIVDINMPGCNGIELIERLNAGNIQCQYIVLTGYSDFHYAQKSIKLNVSDYILKPIDYEYLLKSIEKIKDIILSSQEQKNTLSYLLNKNEEYILEEYFNELINSTLIPTSTHFHSIFETTNIEYPEFTSFCVLVIKPPLNCVKSTLSDLLLSCYFNTKYFFRDQKHCYYLICDTTNQESFIRSVDSLTTAVNHSDLDFNIGVGNIYHNISNLYRSYNEAQVLIKNRHLTVNHLAFYSDLENSEDITILHDKIRNGLKAAILTRDTKTIIDIIDELFSTLIEAKYTFYNAVLVSIQLINLLIEVLSIQTNLPISAMNQTDNNLDNLFELSCIYDLQNKTTQIYLSTINNVTEGVTSQNDITTKIEEYIESHYQETDLTIPHIAEHLFLNYSYLCTIFKKDKNITINDYINQVRIQHAIELFQTGVLNISYVSYQCGYSTPGYFSKRFKNITGLLPSDYCKTILN